MRKILRRSLFTAVGAVLIGSAGIGIATAGTTNVSYSTTVARLNGSGYSEYQRQYISGATGYLYSQSVGSNYVLDARMEGDSDSDWVRNVGDNDSRNLSGNDTSARELVRLQLSNDINTPVAVQATGWWRSN